MNRDREMLLRSLEGSLTAQEASELEARLAVSPGLAAERDRLVRIAGELSSVAADGFEDGFAERVMNRVWAAREAARREDGLYGSLRWVFVRVAPVCGVVAVALGLYSGLVIDAGMSSSLIDTILALPAESFDTALLLELQ